MESEQGQNRISRAQFLRGNLRGNLRGDPDVRPPWSVPEEMFIDTCDRCGTCIARCPQTMLLRGQGGFPRIDFRRGRCDLCGACADGCPSGALRRGAESPPWSLTARLDRARCLAVAAVYCRSCADACESAAIRFRIERGGVATPLLNAAACSGCGVCVNTCPVAAIDMLHCPPAVMPAAQAEAAS
jgi:ferredoxin-type protein NapF